MLLAEIDIGLALHRDEVDVGVGHLKAEDYLSHLATGAGGAEGEGYLLGEDLEGGEGVVVEVEDVVGLLLTLFFLVLDDYFIVGW